MDLRACFAQNNCIAHGRLLRDILIIVTEFYLASSSPRRVDILRSVGAVFTAKGVDIDEVVELSSKEQSARSLEIRRAIEARMEEKQMHEDLDYLDYDLDE